MSIMRPLRGQRTTGVPQRRASNTITLFSTKLAPADVKIRAAEGERDRARANEKMRPIAEMARRQNGGGGKLTIDESMSTHLTCAEIGLATKA
jgi:hypothetical protein